MAKKKATKKKKVANTKSVTEQERLVLVMQELVQFEGWQVIKNNFKANIAFLEDCILDKVDRDGNDLDEKGVDQLRDKREFMKDMIKTPETFISQLRQSKIESGSEDLDPYHTNAQESRNADKEDVESVRGQYIDP